MDIILKPYAAETIVIPNWKWCISEKIINVKYVYFMIYCNAQFIHFGDKGTPGYTAYILLHRSLAVLSIAPIFCAFCCQGVYNSEYIKGNIVILSIYLQNKEQQLFVAFSHTFLYL